MDGCYVDRSRILTAVWHSNSLRTKGYMNRLALVYNPRWSPVCAIVLAKIIVYTGVYRPPPGTGPTLPAGVHASKCPPKSPALPLPIAAVGGRENLAYGRHAGRGTRIPASIPSSVGSL
jgi:hypothetical protein